MAYSHDRLPYLDVELRAWRDLLAPWILAKTAHGDDDGFIQTLGLDFDAVANAARICEADRAESHHQTESVADSLFVRLVDSL